MTRQEFAYELEIQPRFFSSGEFDCNDTNALDLAEKLFCIIDSLEQQNKELIEKYSELSDKYNNTSDLVVELRQQNTAIQLSNSNLSKILDEATYSLRCEELKIERLQQERSNMQKTHQSTISQLQARIKELEEQCDNLHIHFVNQSNAFLDKI